MTDLVTYATDEAMTLAVTGHAPNSFFGHRFGDGQNPDTFFDLSGYSDVKLKVTNGAAGGAASVVVQQIRR